MSGVKKRIKTPLPNNFLTSQNIQQLIDQTIVKLEHECENQNNTDKLYTEVCNIYCSDLSSNAPTT